MADTQLLERCREGDEYAITELVDAYAQEVFRMALSILDDPQEADEAAQEALIAALDGLKAFRGQASFSTWLYTITLNTCRSRLRKRRARLRLQRALFALFHIGSQANPQPEEAALRSESNARLWQAVQSLPENERIATVLRYYQELTVAQIAEVMQVSERTVYKRLQVAHERLRVLLGS